MLQYLSFSLVISSTSGVGEFVAVLHHLWGLGQEALSAGVAQFDKY